MLLLIACFVGGFAALAGDERPPDQATAAQMMDDLMYGRGTVGGPFTLTDQNGTAAQR